MIWGEGGGLEKELSRCQGTTGWGPAWHCPPTWGLHRDTQSREQGLHPHRSPQPHPAAPTLVRGVSCLSGSSRVKRGEL